MKTLVNTRFLLAIVTPVCLAFAACGGGEEQSAGGDGDGDGGPPSYALPIDTTGDGIPDAADTNGDTVADITGGVAIDVNDDGIYDGLDTVDDGLIDVPFNEIGAGGGSDPSGAGGTASGTGGGSGSGGAPAATRVPGTDNYNCDPPSGAEGILQLTEIGSGYTRPVLVTHAPNDPRLFVVEQEGVIKINDGGTFLDITDRALGPIESDNEADERGLLGLAFHPDYATNGLFYVHYSASPGGDTTVAEYSVSADPDVADASSERVLLTVDQPYINHKGGTITFGPDGYLYISLGDGGGPPPTYGGDPDSNGQDPNTLKGTILRIDPTGSSPGQYTAAGNYPGALPEVWSIGLRNPYRINFDACTGDLYIGDVGQNRLEEVNVINAGESGKNFGWDTMEGTECFNDESFDSPLSSCDTTGLTMPVLEYENDGGAALIGGTVYRGSAIPWLRGTYIFGDSVDGGRAIQSTVYDSATSTVSGTTNLTTTLDPPQAITAIQNGHDGEIYVVSAFGTIHQLTAF